MEANILQLMTLITGLTRAFSAIQRVGRSSKQSPPHELLLSNEKDGNYYYSNGFNWLLSRSHPGGRYHLEWCGHR